MTFADFLASLKQDEPNPELAMPLKALWYDGKGDWDKAHHEIDHLNDFTSSRIHAYLHRKEGDIWNADYWYARAKDIRPDIPLEEEWVMLVMRLL